MKVFLTGATGFIGAAVIAELQQAGHTVLGLTRSEEGANYLRATGVDPHYGNLEDSLRSGVAQSDGVIHCGFNHDFSKMLQNCENDRLAIIAMGEVLAGSERPMVISSSVGLGAASPGDVATEDFFDPDTPRPRKASEIGGRAAAKLGAKVIVVRLPQVHDPVKQGLITYFVAIDREKGLSAYVGDGTNRWAAAHVSDVARLYRLALEKGEAGAVYNAVAEEGIMFREVAEVIGRGMKVPVKSVSGDEATAHFGWMMMFAGLDLQASSKLTQQRLGWTPTGPGLIADLEAMTY